MLVLTRKVGERINIGDEIVVRVVEANRGHVRLGIEAPVNISVHRQEVYEKIQEQNRLASRGLSTEISSVAGLLRNKRLKEGKIDN